MTDQIRAFIAASISNTACERIDRIRKKLRSEIKDLRWVKKENIHLTLKFLGNIPADSIDTVSDELDKILTGYKPLSMVLSGLGVFPDERMPRILWAGLEGDINRLAMISRALNEKLNGLGGASTKNHFTPHITFGRFKKKKIDKNIINFIKKYEQELEYSFKIDEIVFYRSDLTESGAVYTPLFKKTLNQ